MIPAKHSALKASVMHERLVAEYGFAGSYQRVKLFLRELRPRIAAELAFRFYRSHGPAPVTDFAGWLPWTQ